MKKKLTILTEFDLHQIVYLKTDKEQLPRMVIGYYVSDTSVTYRLTQGTTDTPHYAAEISETKDVLMQLANDNTG